MGPSQGDPHNRYKLLVDAHHALRQKMNALLVAVDRWSRQPPDQEGITDVQDALQEFTKVLLQHFTWEEKDGYMQPLVDHAPQVRVEVDRLRKDHSHMRSELAALNDQARETTPENSPKLEAGLRSFLGTLHDHESREDQLVQETFYRDAGCDD